ncbi:hypothetical protein PGB90_004452 [Kerria lacca]
MEINLKELKKDVADKLLRGNLTNANKLLLLTEDELQRMGNFTTEDVKEIFFLASKTLIQPNLICLESRYVTVGCKNIDIILGGGLKSKCGINELSGESGCGKTQFCLRLALTAQNPVSVGGLNPVLYICTEDNFPSKRLQQLIGNIRPPFKNSREISYGDRIYIEHIADVTGLKNCLFTRFPSLLKTNTIGLLIIDSITAIFRADYTVSEGIQRTKDLRSIGCQLHSLSRKYDLCVLCVNQVSASINDPVNHSVPALGLVWANLVTTRIIMTKCPSQNKKKIELIFSPHAKPATCDYIITEFGIEGLS